MDNENKVELDISVNKVLDPFNSKLLLTYSLADDRFHKLALILKKWNKMVSLDKKLNSFSLNLILIAYM